MIETEIIKTGIYLYQRKNMKLDIKKIQGLIEQGEIKWTVHGLARMQERDIRIADVKSCISTGEIIEEYLDDYPCPSCLIFGYSVNNAILHTVVGMDETCVYVITSYYPDTIKFEDDLKTRRRC